MHFNGRPVPTGNKIDNIVVVSLFIIFCPIKHLFGKSDKLYTVNVKHYFLILFILYREHIVSVDKINR